MYCVTRWLYRLCHWGHFINGFMCSKFDDNAFSVFLGSTEQIGFLAEQCGLYKVVTDRLQIVRIIAKTELFPISWSSKYVWWVMTRKVSRLIYKMWSCCIDVHICCLFKHYQSGNRPYDFPSDSEATLKDMGGYIPQEGESNKGWWPQRNK